MKSGILNIQDNLLSEEYQLIYDSGALATAATSITISSLDGDVAIEYIIVAFLKNDYNGARAVYVRPNNDSGANYGYQLLDGQSTSVEASRATGQTGLFIGYSDAQNKIDFHYAKLISKSGFYRTMLSKWNYICSGTTVGLAAKIGQVWNNSADNITSLVIVSSEANGIGVGSHIMVFALQPKV